jgi:hypothetical protein
VTLVLEVLGRGLAVEFDTDDAREQARSVLFDLVAGVADIDQHIRAHGADAATLLQSLVGTINLAAVRFGAGSLMPHAAAVARPDGSVALLCGASGSGKSTLAGELLRRGCAYLTDETSVLDPDTLEVQPFPKPLSFKVGSHGVFADVHPAWAADDDVWLVPSGDIAEVSVPTSPLEPRLLVFPTYNPLVDGAQMEEVSPGEAAYLVGTQSSRLRDVVGGPLPALARLARRVRAYRLRYSDSADASEGVLALWPT